eukprot:4101813-Amphidinium_carterae.1
MSLFRTAGQCEREVDRCQTRGFGPCDAGLTMSKSTLTSKQGWYAGGAKHATLANAIHQPASAPPGAAADLWTSKVLRCAAYHMSFLTAKPNHFRYTVTIGAMP